MKRKLAIAFVIVIALMMTEGCRKSPVETRDSGGNGPGNVGGTDSTGRPINKKPPVADAGPDQTITVFMTYQPASLNGNNSYDSSGMSLQFSWRQISGPSNSFLHSPTQKACGVSINAFGVYSFELWVWNKNGEDFDTTNITISSPSYCQSNRPEIPATLTFLANMPQQIENPEIIPAGNKLICPEWFNARTGVVTNNIHIYDLSTQNWTTVHASLARMAVSTIVAGNRVFFAGGVSSDEDYIATSVVDIFDLTTNTWTTSKLSEARGYCKAVVSGNKIFFAGGLRGGNALSNVVDIYDLQTNSWSSASLPGGARAVSGAVTAQNKILFCGGYSSYDNPTGFGYTLTTPTAAIDVYDTNSGQWSTSTMTVSKASFASICVNEKVFLAGGEVDYGSTFHVEELDVTTMNHSNACLHQPTVSYNSNNAAVKNNMVVFFSHAGPDVSKFDIYDTQTRLWSMGVLPPGLLPRNSFTAITSVNNEIYAVIGDKLYKMSF